MRRGANFKRYVQGKFYRQGLLGDCNPLPGNVVETDRMAALKRLLDRCMICREQKDMDRMQVEEISFQLAQTLWASNLFYALLFYVLTS